MKLQEFFGLTSRERHTKFFQLADKLGLVKDGHYISGIPSGSEEDVNLFYSLEDWLEYPEACKIPQNYLGNDL
jgi:hypothetical protein